MSTACHILSGKNKTKTSHKLAGGQGQGGEGKTLRSLIFEAAPVKAKPASLLRSIFPLCLLTRFALAKEGVVSVTFIPDWEKFHSKYPPCPAGLFGP